MSRTRISRCQAAVMLRRWLSRGTLWHALIMTKGVVMTSPTTARALGLGSLRAQTARYCQVSIMETPRESDDVFKIDEEYSDSGKWQKPC